MSATPRTDQVINLLRTENKPVIIPIAMDVADATALSGRPHQLSIIAQLIAHARQLETELATWRTLPPREHYNLDDCQKALQWHLKQLNIEHEHIGQILARMAELQQHTLETT